jgi:pimeloyl-ACP methyl ester carboxylesterase
LSSSSAALSIPEGPDSVSGAPSLPAGFADTFASRYVETGELRQHAVVGGEGPPLQRRSRPLAMPVLAIGGEASYGDHVGEAMKLVADDVQSVVIPGTGHWVAEDAPEETLAALTEFLSPYRDGKAARPQPAAAPSG